MPNLGLFLKSQEFESYPAGAVVFREGDVGEQMYVVKQGEVEVKLGDRVLGTLGEGHVVGEMALIDKGPRSATVVARTACQLVPINEKSFKFLVQQNPFFALELMRAIVGRVRDMNRKG